MPQGGHRSPLPPHTEAAEGLSEHGRQKGLKEMERECVGAGEPFPCTAAASAGTGATEQERREGAVARPEPEGPSANTIRAGKDAGEVSRI